jgi:uncharacterized protein YgiM (DUF1202 family)
MTEEPAVAEAAATSPIEAPSSPMEQTVQEDNAPSGDARPETTGQGADGETVEPSVFVNLREGPSSSAAVLGVVAKGAKLPVLDRKRGWVQVTDPAGGKTGWIYSGLLVGEAKPQYRRVSRVAPAESEPKSESFWGRIGRWLSPSKEN